MNSLPTSDISVNLIARENTPVVWILVKERIKKTIDNWGEGEFTLEEVQDDLATGRRQLWIVNNKQMDIKLVAITKVVVYSQVTRLLIELIEGKGMTEATHTLNEVERVARLQFGATQIEAHIRPDLAERLEKFGGFKRSRVVLIRDSKDAYLSGSKGKVEQGKV